MTLKQALWEIVRDENIIITNQNIDWLLDRALKKASGDAQALKESVLERKEKLDKLGESELLINQNKSNNFEVKSNNELFKQALVEGLNRHFDKTIEEEKQIEEIEEMAVENLAAFLWNNTNMYDEDLIFDVAEALYNAGYRKQSEGEWIWTESGTEDYEQYWLCSCCNNKSYWKSKFCEECGAKMKGGRSNV
jgi:hypothetical protein